MADNKLHVGVIGAGLGGLAAAIGIARAGHRATILEQTPVLGEVSPTGTWRPNHADCSKSGRCRHPDTAQFVPHP